MSQLAATPACRRPSLSDHDPPQLATPEARDRIRRVRERPARAPGGLHRRIERGQVPRTGKHAEEGHDLGVIKGLAALSLDALSSVAYGPEAMMLVLVLAGTSALHDVVPLTVVITAMLVLLVISYTQVIAAHPEGGGSYSVAKANLGRWPSLLAAASVVVDYVLTVAVSLAAGAASLGSVFPGLAHHLLPVALIGLLILTVVNMFGIQESAKLLVLPTAVFLVSIFATIVVGALHSHSGGDDRYEGDVPGHRDARGPAAAQGVRRRVLGGHRRRGDLERRAGVQKADRPDRPADRDLARRAARRDAARAWRS